MLFLTEQPEVEKVDAQTIAIERADLDMPVECDHAPDKTDIVDSTYWGNEVHLHLQCECGERFTEVYRYHCTIDGE